MVNPIKEVRKTSLRWQDELMIEPHSQLQTHIHPQSVPQMPALHSSLTEDRGWERINKEGLRKYSWEPWVSMAPGFQSYEKWVATMGQHKRKNMGFGE